MNRNIYIVIICLMGLMTLGCSKSFLEQHDPNAIPTKDFFQTENDVLLALNGAYEALRSGSGVGEGSTLYNEERSDNAGRNDNQSNAGEPFQFNDFSLLPSNTYIKTHWFALYSIITRANFVIDGADKVTYASEATRNNYIAEAKFIRAFIYFNLVMKWGDVPLTLHPITSAARANEQNFRVKKSIVYDSIVADLKYGAENSTLPNSRIASEKGRVSRAAINGFLGKVYLTMALTLDAGKRNEYLAQARKYLDACYAMKSFNTLSDIPYAEVFNVERKLTNPEILFQIEYKQGDLNFYSSIAASYQAKGEKINSKKSGTGAGGVTKLDLIKDYEPGDLRKDFSVKFANDKTVNDWFITKFRDTSAAAGPNGYGGNDWIVLRYADVVLMLAEVNNYLGNTDIAISFLNQARTRAGLADYNTAMLNAGYVAKYPNLKLAILHERRVELAFENQRLFDLLRTFTAQEFADYFRSKNQVDYGIAKLSNIGVKDYYYPIPVDEYKLDPNKMYQNPGY